MDEDPEKKPDADSQESILDTFLADRIRTACAAKDITAVISQTVENDGLLHDDLRSLAWPLLLGCTPDKDTTYRDWEGLPPHKDEEQVDKDVDRSFVNYPNGICASPSHSLPN
jgi:hypothetical protein